MKLDDVKNILENLTPGPVDVKDRFSVLIPLVEVDGKLSLLYEVRSLSLRSQPGEISFPGGRIEKGETPRKAAIRETIEELNVSENEIEVITDGDFLVNPYHAIIYSTVGVLKRDFDKIEPSTDEVDSIFSVPLEFFMENEPKIYELDLAVMSSDDFPYDLIPNGKDYNFKRGIDRVHFYEYEDKIIWGFTAKMTYELINRLKRGN